MFDDFSLQPADTPTLVVRFVVTSSNCTNANDLLGMPYGLTPLVRALDPALPFDLDALRHFFLPTWDEPVAAQAWQELQAHLDAAQSAPTAAEARAVEEMAEKRLKFARWLVEHDRLNETDVSDCALSDVDILWITSA